MRIRLRVVLSVVALAGIAVFAAISSGGTGSTSAASTFTPPPDNGARHVTGHQVKRSDVPQRPAGDIGRDPEVLRHDGTSRWGGDAHRLFSTSVVPRASTSSPGSITRTEPSSLMSSISLRGTVRTWQFGFDNLLNSTGQYRSGSSARRTSPADLRMSGRRPAAHAAGCRRPPSNAGGWAVRKAPSRSGGVGPLRVVVIAPLAPLSPGSTAPWPPPARGPTYLELSERLAAGRAVI